MTTWMVKRKQSNANYRWLKKHRHLLGLDIFFNGKDVGDREKEAVQ